MHRPEHSHESVYRGPLQRLLTRAVALQTQSGPPIDAFATPPVSRGEIAALEHELHATESCRDSASRQAYLYPLSG